MAIQGLRDTSDFTVTGQRPENWREGMLLLDPNGMTPLTGLTSAMKKRVTDDALFHWFEKSLETRRVELHATNGDLTTTNTVTATGWLSNQLICEASASATVTVEVPPASCADGKAQVLWMLYTGEDCSETSHSQDPGKVSCDGDPDDATPVHIIASDKADLSDPKTNVWFNGVVNLGDLFPIDATVAGQAKLKANTYVTIQNGSGVLQTLMFHTSCSQPLNVGDQFGSLVLDQFIPEP